MFLGFALLMTIGLLIVSWRLSFWTSVWRRIQNHGCQSGRRLDESFGESSFNFPMSPDKNIEEVQLETFLENELRSSSPIPHSQIFTPISLGMI